MSEDVNPLVRIAEALESLARNVERLANPLLTAHAEPGKTTILYAANAPKGL